MKTYLNDVQLQTETMTDVVAKASPPVVVSGLTLFGYGVPELIQLLTLIYVVFMVINQGWTLINRIRNRKKKDEYKE